MLHRFVLYPRLIRRQSLGEIVHILDHSSAHLLDHLPKRCKTVVTVHDLIPLVDSDGLTDRQVARYRAVVQRLVHADRLVAVSEYTKSELIRLLGIDADRIVVVPNGVCHEGEGRTDWDGVEEIDAWREGTGGLVIGSVGSAVPRKNLEVIASAAAILAERGIKVSLARVGAALPEALRARMEGIVGSDGLLEFGHVDSAELSAFYRSVDVVVVPSRYEGFGLPVLEAMQFGIPVVSSNATSLPEVGGEAALYFEPDDAEALAGHLEALCDGEARAKLAGPSRRRAGKFSWRRHLESLYALYGDLMGDSTGDAARQVGTE